MHHDISLVFFIKDNHCYPITEERLKILATKGNQGGVDNLSKYMSEMKWSCRHEQFVVINDMEEEAQLNCARYDIKTRDILTKFLEIGKVTAEFADRKPLYKNICYLNSTRQKVTKECCDRFTEGKQSYEVEFIYDGKKEVYPVCARMPVLVTTNLKSDEIYNMMEFEVKSIDKQTVMIADTVFPIDKFSQSFIKYSSQHFAVQFINIKPLISTSRI